jgi:ParB/RepB/Spo0J family partition protein
VRMRPGQTTLPNLAASIQLRGVLKPILVRANGDGFLLIDGARRLRASRLAGCTDIPARVRDVDEAVAEDEMIIANLHHEDVQPLDEANGYKRLVDGGRTVDELAARLGKSKRYIYEILSLTRLVPQIQDLVARDVLPLNYALKLAAVDVERQPEGLAHCFRPLFREEPRRDQLEPLSGLVNWIEKAVRLDPRSEDTNVLLPELAGQVATIEQERNASILALSTLHFHTDKTDPKPILVKSWKPAEGSQKCRHAQPGVIVLGEGQGTFIQVCIAKKECRKHWGKPSSKPPGSANTDKADDGARRKQEEEYAAKQAETERWRTELRGRALGVIAERSTKLTWTPRLISLLLEELRADDSLTDIVGPIHKLSPRRYPQALAVALACRHSWQRDELLRFARKLGVVISAKALIAEQTTEDT